MPRANYALTYTFWGALYTDQRGYSDSVRSTTGGFRRPKHDRLGYKKKAKGTDINYTATVPTKSDLTHYKYFGNEFE